MKKKNKSFYDGLSSSFGYDDLLNNENSSWGSLGRRGSYIDPFYRKTSLRTQGHESYSTLTYGDVLNKFRELNVYNQEKEFYQLCVDAANIISHIKVGSDYKNAITSQDVSEKIVEILYTFLQKLPESAKKGTPLEIAANLVQLLQDLFPPEIMLQLQQECANAKKREEERKKQEQEKKAQQKAEQAEKGENDDKNGDDDKGGKNSEGKDKNEDGEKEDGKGDAENGDVEDGDENDSKGEGEGEGEGEENDGSDESNSQSPGKSDKENQESNETSPHGGESEFGYVDLLIEREITDKIIKVVSEYFEQKEVFERVYERETLKLRYRDYEKMDPKKLKFLDKIAILESRGKMRAVKKLATPNVTTMEDYSQVKNVRGKTQMAHPLFKYRFATKSLIVKAPSNPTKQAICLMIDNSGSMNCVFKKNWVYAIIYNRCMEAERNNCVLYICTFLYDVANIKPIRTRYEGQEYYSKHCSFNGGGTNVQGCAEFMMDYFKKKNLTVQVTVINDGQDYVDKDWVPKQELHAIMLGDENDGLKKVIERAEGHYEVFYSD